MTDDPNPPAEAWDKIAKNYNRMVSHITIRHAFDLLSSVVEQIRSAKTVLDVACGAGAFGRAYIQMFPEGIPGQTLIMSDVSSEMVKVAEEEMRLRLPSNFQTDLQFRTESVKDMKSITDGSIDVLVSIFGVFLVAPREAVFSELRRVLKPEGTFAMTAWTDLPKELDFNAMGYGAEFQATVGKAFDVLRGPKPSEKQNPPVWLAWKEPDEARKYLRELSFSKIKIHRTIHTTTFPNIEVLWDTISKTCPFVDTSAFNPEQLQDIKRSLTEASGIESAEDIVYLVTSANIMVAVPAPLTH